MPEPVILSRTEEVIVAMTADVIETDVSLTTAERARLAGIRDERRRREFLQGRWLVRAGAAELLGCAMTDVVIESRCADCGGEHGAPQVTWPGRVEVSIAHASGVTVAAVSVVHRVGIDIEADHRPAERIAAIHAITGGDESDGSDAAQLRHWTRVESVLKADRRGLRVDPRFVRVQSRMDQVTASIADEPARYGLTEIPLPGHVVTLAALEHHQPGAHRRA